MDSCSLENANTEEISSQIITRKRHKGSLKKTIKNVKSKKKEKTKTKFCDFKCDICSKIFAAKDLLQRHKLIHSTDTHCCQYCDFTSNVERYVARHVRRNHRDSKHHECMECGKKYQFKSGLEHHMLVHTGEKPFKCDICSKAFNTTYSLNTHKFIHTNEKPFKCTQCEYACRDSSTLRKHRAIHTGLHQLYICKTCGKTLKSKWKLKNHVAEEHLQLDIKNHACTLCERRFKQKAHLTRHFNVVHKKSTQVTCEVCGVKKPSKAHLYMHLLSHVDVRPHECPFEGCGKTFKKTHDLNRHAIIHYPDRHYPCEICNRTFSRSHRLKRHLSQHIPKKKTVECHHCGVCFYNKNYLANHIRVKHTGRKQRYICDMCGFVTHNKPSIVMHIKHGHPSEDDRECKRCHKKFKRNVYLKLHYIRSHGVRYKTKERKPKVEIKEEPEDFEDRQSIDLFEIEKHELVDEENLQEPEANSEESAPPKSAEELAVDIIRDNRRHLKRVPESIFNDLYIDSVLSMADSVKDPEASRPGRKPKHRYRSDRACQEKEKQGVRALLARVRRQHEAKTLERTRRQYNERMKTANKKENIKRKYLNNTHHKKTSKKYKVESEVNNDKLNDKSLKDKHCKLHKTEAKHKRNNSNLLTNKLLNDESTNEEENKTESQSDLSEHHPFNDNKERDSKEKELKKNDNSSNNSLNDKQSNDLEGEIEINKNEINNDSPLNYKYFNDSHNENELRVRVNITRHNSLTTEPPNDSEDVYKDNMKSLNDKQSNEFENRNKKKDDTDDDSSNKSSNNKQLVQTNNNDLEKEKVTKSTNAKKRRNIINKRNKNKRLNKNKRIYKDDSDSLEGEPSHDDDGDSDWKDEEMTKNKNAKKSNKIIFNSHQCYTCFKLYDTKEKLLDHCKDHFDICNNVSLKKCPLCDYVSKYNLRRHMWLRHDIKITVPYARMKDRKHNNNGSRYYFEVDNAEFDKIEVIPSVKNLNKIACTEIDRRNREAKAKFVAKTKLVKKGNEWIVIDEKIKVNAKDFILPEELVDEEAEVKGDGKKIQDNGKINVVEEKNNSYIARMKRLSVLAKKNGKKMMFPCEACDKICLNLAALILHSRKHDPNAKPFKPKVWKHKMKGKVTDSVEVIEKKKATDKLLEDNRNAKPKPIVNKHKCDPELKKFYEDNIRGKDIEFWQFLKIYNKMDRENIKDFKDLDKRIDFGIHPIANTDKEDVTESGSVLTEKVTTDESVINEKGAVITDNKTVVTDNEAVLTEKGAGISDKESVITEKDVVTDNETVVTGKGAFTSDKVYVTTENDAKNNTFEPGKLSEVTKKLCAKITKRKVNTKKYVYRRVIRINKKEHMRRNEIKKKLREKLSKQL